MLVITGVGGDEEHEQKFATWAQTFIESARKKEGVAESNITLLSNAPSTRPESRSTRANVEQAFRAIGTKVKPNDEVFILLIGHGSFDGQVAAFNLPGPDLTAADYAKLVGGLRAQRIVFVNTASSSGAFLQPLAGPGRVVVTATKTGGERNETEFPQYFVAAFGDSTADTDRNGHVSVQEAFDYAKTNVGESVKQRGVILTEHATIEDGAEGRVASMVFLGTGRSADAVDVDLNDPAARALVEARDALQARIVALQVKKASMDPDQYQAEMEKLLTELALKTKALRDLKKK